MTDMPDAALVPQVAPEKVGRSRVVLHIGTHKTATTTIQDTFWENSDLLAEHGVIYPRLGLVTGHHGLAYDWANLPPIYELEGGSRARLQALTTQYAHQPVTVFLSSEEFSRGDPKGATDFAEVRRLLSDFDEIQVICTLRPQWEFLQSVYLEVSKYRSPPRPAELIHTALNTGMVEGIWVDYLRLLDRLEEVFAPEEVMLLDFEAARRSEGGILGTFLRHLGVINISATDLVAVNGGASNVSPKPATAWAANILSEPQVAPPWLLTLVGEAVDLEFSAEKRTCLFVREELRMLEKHFAPLNESLCTRRAPYQPGFTLTPPDIGPLSVFRNTIPQSFWVRVGRRMTARAMKHKDF